MPARKSMPVAVHIGLGCVCLRTLVCLVALAVSGCASTPSRHPDFVPETIKSVYVFSVRAPTDARQQAARMTSEMQRLLSVQRKVFPVDELALADGLIEAKIERVFIDPLTRSADGKIDKARWCLDVEFSFKDVKKKTFLLERCKLSGVREIQLMTSPVTDTRKTAEIMADEMAAWIVDWCMSGQPPRYNPLFGYEHLPDTESDGLLIGKPRVNRDKNNDGIDDAQQGYTNQGF